MKMRCGRWLSATALVSVLGIHAPQVLADSLPLDEVTVYGKHLGGLTSPSVADAAKKITRTPGAVDLVTQEEFADLYAVGMQDMLNNTPGVFVKQRFAEEVRLSIRGSGLSRSFHMRGIKLLQDGVPITLADNSTDFQEVDPASLRYVEVYKGANALRYGAANLGGAVNFVMPTGRTAANPAYLSLEGGSFETLRLHGHYAYADDARDYFLAGTLSHGDGYRDHSQQDNRRLFGNMGFKLNDRAETRFYLAINNINQELPGALPLSDVFNNPKRALPNILAGDQARDINSVRLSNKTTIDLGEATLNFALYGFYKDLYHPIFQVVDQETFEYGTFAEVETPFSLGDLPGSFVVGVNLGRGKTDAKRYINNGGKRGMLTADADHKSTNIEGYVDARLEVLPAFSVITGGQLVHARRDYEDHLNPVMSDEVSHTSFSPKFGLLWDVSDEAQVFANISRSYEPATFSELVQAPLPGFVPIVPQRAWTAEIGTRGVTGSVSWDITFYRARVRDELLQYTVSPDIPASTFNAGKTLHQGIEAGLALNLPAGFTLRQTYTLNDFRFRDDPQYGNNRLAGVPKHLYRAELRWHHESGFHVCPNVDWAMSRAVVDFANTVKVPRYAVANINAGLSLEHGLSFYADVRNIFGKRYVSNYGTLTDARLPINQDVYYPGEGRAFYFGIKWGFGA